jgi:hypothetical protein
MASGNPTPRSNVQRLLDEGVAIQAEGLPKEYEDVIEDLDPGAIALIVDVNRRLQRAQEQAQTLDPAVEPFVRFIPPL